MQDTMSESNWSSARELVITTEEDNVAVVEVELSASDRAMLEEAIRLSGIKEASEVLRVALRELVERQRFLSWVAAHDRKERSGTA